MGAFNTRFGKDGMKNQFRQAIPALTLAIVFMVFISACVDRHWIEYKADDGSFIVSFPVTPTKSIKTANTVLGPIDVTIYAAEENHLAYLVATGEYPADLVKQADHAGMLNDARDGAVANVQGNLMSEEIFNLNGNPGRELKIAVLGGKGIVRCKVVLVANRLYQVIVAGPSDKAYAPEVRQFLDSFSLL